MLARTPFFRLVAQLLVFTLVFGLVPAPPAQASIPEPSASAAMPAIERALSLPELPSIAESVPPVLLAVVAIAEGKACAVVFAVVDPHMPSKYHRARWMDPRVGRFISSDTWEPSVFDPPTLHRYTYVRNDPANRVDPTGLYEGGLSGALTTVSAQMTLIGTRVVAGTITRLGAIRALRALNWTFGILTAAYHRFGNIFVQLEHALERGSGRVDIVLRTAPQVIRRAVIEGKAWSLDAIAQAPGRAVSMLDQLRSQAVNYAAEFGDDLIYAFPELPRTPAGQALLREVQSILSSAGVQRVTFGVQQLMDEVATLLK